MFAFPSRKGRAVRMKKRRLVEPQGVMRRSIRKAALPNTDDLAEIEHRMILERRRRTVRRLREQSLHM